MNGINFKQIRRRLLTKLITDFIKYYPEILDNETCDLIVSELKKVDLTNVDSVFVRTSPYLSSGGSFLYSINVDDNGLNLSNSYFRKLADAITIGKNRYLEEQPKYSHRYGFSSGENFGVYEDVGSKLLVQYYPVGGSMSEHIDNTKGRFYMKEHHELCLERPHAQLSCLLYLNEDYEGGTFVVADQEYETKKGSVIYYPATFMFPHKVNTVTKGERWSVATWLR